MKKIFIIISELSLGGTEKQINTILKELSKTNKYEFHLITLLSKGNYFEQFKNIDNIFLYNFFNLEKKNFLKKIIFSLFSIIYLKNLIDKIRPSIVHFYLPTSYLIGGSSIFFNSHKPKYIMSRRSLNLYQKNYLLINKYEKILHTKMDIITANCQCIVNDLKNEGVKSNKIIKIFNGIKIYNNNKVSFFNNNNHNFNFLLLANYIPYKGHKFLIDSVLGLEQIYLKKIHITFVGKINKYSHEINKYIKKNSLKEIFSIKNYTLDTEKYFLRNNIGISVSSEEGLSNSIMEYMNYNMPVIATSVGGNSELIRNNYNGILVEYKDVHSLRNAIKYYIDNPDEIMKHGKNSKKLLIKNFNLQNALDKHHDLYSIN